MKLIETIQILDGEPQRLSYHNERFNRSRKLLFCLLEEVFLEEYLQIPIEFQTGKVKCRVLYDTQVRKVEYELYQERLIDRFYLVESNLDYDHKYHDRSVFQELLSSLESSSEIIILKNGYLTDTSYCNLLFKDHKQHWWTPQKPLLRGTHRAFLLDEGLIEEREISVQDLPQFSHLMMINAMLNFDEKRAVKIDETSLHL